MSKSANIKVSDLTRLGEMAEPFRQLVLADLQKMLYDAVSMELKQFIEENAHRRTAQDAPAVVRNGYHLPRMLLTPLGALAIKIPKVRSRDQKQAVFRSELVPSYVRHLQMANEELPWLYLHGRAAGSMEAALTVLVGVQQFCKLNNAVVKRLKQSWENNKNAWRKYPLGSARYVSLWADCICPEIRGNHDNLCFLVVIVETNKREKSFLAIEEVQCASKQGWRDLLGDLKSRKIKMTNVAAVNVSPDCKAVLDQLFPIQTT